MADSMNFALTEDQAALVAAVNSLLRAAAIPQNSKLTFHYFDALMQHRLADAGFLDAARGVGMLEAALVVMETSRLPGLVEAAASAMVVPMLLPNEALAGPIALVNGRELMKAHRNLSIARHAIIDLGDDVVVLPLAEGDVVGVDTVLGYPYGKFTSPELKRGRRLGASAVGVLRQWWRASLAAEFGATAQSAIAFTVEYVKDRHVFGKPIGSFQAVQHRLAQCHQIARGIHFLALKAAWSGDTHDAALAACYAQQHVGRFIFDLHQFNGAMGVTNEHLLHFWLYRLRALQAEVGGASGSALEIADRLWGRSPAQPA